MATGPITDPTRPWWQRLFALPNVVSIALGITAFVIALNAWDSTRGALWASLIGAVVTGLTWWVWRHLTKPAPITDILTSPRVGTIPEHKQGPTPVLTDPDSVAAMAYYSAAERLEASTTGQVLLVASPSPGQGATTVAMNLAISATRAGRRVLLMDGDTATRKLSRFGRTGPSPGLTELARGTATLDAASRLWQIDDVTRMPVIPAGSITSEPATALEGPALADAIDRVTEKADLVLIDSAPILWNDSSRPLAAHADGTVLVLSEGTEAAAVVATRDRFAAAGAPIVGYIVNRFGSRVRPRRPAIRLLKRSVATFIIVFSALAAWNGLQLWDTWRNVERDELDTAAANALLPLPVGGIIKPPDVDEETAAVVTAEPSSDEVFTSFLVVGSDLGGFRADVIVFTLLPSDSSPPIMVSIPRDLYLPNRCTQGYTRVNANLGGCGDEVNGPTLLALAVEDYTGIEVDHFALFDFTGFEQIIDEVGGVEICVDHPVRDAKSFLDLPAGCTTAQGEQGLAWVRSRQTEELVDSRWRPMEGASDLTRNQRQQDVILGMFTKLRQFESPADLNGKVRSLANAFVLDDQLGLGDAIGLLWDLRDVNLAGVRRIQIPVRNHVTPSGAHVLLPLQQFDELLREAYPAALSDGRVAG